MDHMSSLALASTHHSSSLHLSWSGLEDAGQTVRDIVEDNILHKHVSFLLNSQLGKELERNIFVV